MFEAPINYRDASVQDWVNSDAVVDLFAPPEDTTRVFADSKCNACKSFLPAVVQKTVSGKSPVDANKLVLSAQIVCGQHLVAKELSIPCQTFDDLRTWFLKGKLISGTRVLNLAQARDKPEVFCQFVGACSAGDSSAGGNSGAVAVRMKLRIDITQVPRASPKWAEIVKSFLADVAGVLNVAPSRLQLHIHQGDLSIVEVVITRNPDNEEYSGTQVGNHSLRSYTPLELAVRLKMLITSGKSYLHTVPERLTALIDPAYNIKIVAVAVPTKN